MEKIKIKINSIIFIFLQIIFTLILGLISFIALFMSYKIASKIARFWSYVNLTAMKYICKIDYEVSGLENLKNINKENYIFVSKHESFWETFYLFYLIPNACFILKKELLSIPFFGWYLRKLGMIAINRKDGKNSMRKIILFSKEKLKQNRNIIIFPEGTRVKNGTVNKLKSGIFHIYKDLEKYNLKTKYKIIPVALNSGKCCPKTTYQKYPGTIKVNIHKPLPVDKEFDKEEFLEIINKKINF